MNESEIKEKLNLYARIPLDRKLTIYSDTTEFMRIKSGDVLELGGSYYVVRGEEVEGRFGLDGEPKFWVKRVIDLSDGSSKIVKMVFHESFVMQLGEENIQCFRSPPKEARILEKIKDDPYFMHGFNVFDTAGNAVRVIERIQGKRYYDYILDMPMDHETYYHEVFPEVYKKLFTCFEAMDRLHKMGEVHGDVRNDHILIDRETGIYKWIDFDYSYEWSENPFGIDLFGLGNILLMTIGKGFYNVPDLNACGPLGMKLKSCLDRNDLSLFIKHRVMNLKKMFPYIPDELNHILLHFSHGAEVFYESTEELLNDLKACEAKLPH